MQEQEPYEGDGLLPDNPSLTRQALCAKAEELAVELVRWKVWRVEGQAHENLQEAQAIQALVMVLIELLDNVQGSPAAAQAELARAVSLLGYALPLPVGSSGRVAEVQQVSEAEDREDVEFLRAHGLRLSADDEETHGPLL
jgi:hypothetical protein